MKNIKALASELFGTIEKHNPHALTILPSGRPVEEIAEKLQLNFPSYSTNEYLISLYEKKDGIKEQFMSWETVFFSNLSLASLEEMSERISSDSFLNFKGKNFYPFMSSGSGEFLGFYLQEFEDKKELTSLYYVQTWDYEIDTFSKRYDSLLQFNVTIDECYKRKIYKLKNRELQTDSDAEFKLCRKLNPESTYWKRSWNP